MESIKVIDENQEALLWRLRMIRHAKHSLVLFTFKMRDDNSGRDILSALVSAAEKGVEEYILVDSISSNFHCKGSENVQYLASFENVHFCFYNPVFFNPFRITFRMHDKILLIDEEVYMVGGRNVLDVSIGNYKKKYNIDRDVVVLPGDEKEQASFRQIIHYIKSMQSDRTIKEFLPSVTEEKKKQTGEILRTRFQTLCQANPMIEEDLRDPAAEGFVPAEEIRLISGDPDYHFKGLEIWSQLVRLMESGNDVLVQTPYIMCNKLMYQGLREVIKADDSFAIITNAPEAGANYLGCADYMNQRKKIRRQGIKVYECCAGQSLHTKSILIDDELSVIGSFNFDTRSAYMDTELMLFVRSKEVNRLLRQKAEEMIAKSRTIDAEGNVTYGTAYKGQKMKLHLKLFYAVLRVMVRPFRFLL